MATMSNSPPHHTLNPGPKLIGKLVPGAKSGTKQSYYLSLTVKPSSGQSFKNTFLFCKTLTEELYERQKIMKNVLQFCKGYYNKRLKHFYYMMWFYQRRLCNWKFYPLKPHSGGIRFSCRCMMILFLSRAHKIILPLSLC